MMMKNSKRPGAARVSTHPRPGRRPVSVPAPREIVLREIMGGVLREIRQDQGRTLREVSSAAQVSLGYLSEIERGQKEASSELLSSICQALSIPLSVFLKNVALRVYTEEQAARVVVPDTVPANLMSEVTASA